MTEYRHGAHTVFRIHLHIVWVTKYRKPVMRGEVGLRLRRADPRNLRLFGSHDYQRSCLKRPSAFVRQRAAERHHQASGPDVEREK